MIRWLRVGAAGGVLALAAACSDGPVQLPGEGPVVDDLEGLEQGIHPVLSIPGLAAWSRGETMSVRLHLQAVDVDASVQSYQGELRFDADRITVRDAVFPGGFLGAWNEVEPGVLRFAGVTLEGVDEQPVVELLVVADHRPSAADFEVVVEELVGAGSGGGFQDLTPRVVPRKHPLLTLQHLDRREPDGS